MKSSELIVLNKSSIEKNILRLKKAGLDAGLLEELLKDGKPLSEYLSIAWEASYDYTSESNIKALWGLGRSLRIENPNKETFLTTHEF